MSIAAATRSSSGGPQSLFYFARSSTTLIKGQSSFTMWRDKYMRCELYKYGRDVFTKGGDDLIMCSTDSSLCDESCELALHPKLLGPPPVFPHLNSQTFVLMEIQSPWKSAIFKTCKYPSPRHKSTNSIELLNQCLKILNSCHFPLWWLFWSFWHFWWWGKNTI